MRSPSPAADATLLRGRPTATAAVLLACSLGLAGCSALSDSLSPAKVDYRSGAVRNNQPLEVPPDLTQLSSDPRYQPPSASVSAVALQQSGGSSVIATDGSSRVAPSQLGTLRIERSGSARWLVSPQSPEQLWPQLRDFWQTQGFTLAADRPELGVMETDWAENRAKLPQNWLRRTVGKVLDGVHDTGERDLYRTRIERSAAGTEIYITHRGAVEEYVDRAREETRWQPRANDPQLEAEMLGLLMQQLSAGQGSTPVTTAKAATPAQPQATETTAPARARELSGRPALQVDDDFDRAWRRVGVALDRSGFTVEDRDRSQGVYYVRYVDPKLAGVDEPNFFARVFAGAKKASLEGTRYQLSVKGEGSGRSTVTVLDSQGNAPGDNESARNIVQLLVSELR